MTVPDSRPAVAPTGAGRYPMRDGGVAVITHRMEKSRYPWKGAEEGEGIRIDWTDDGRVLRSWQQHPGDIIGPRIEPTAHDGGEG